MSALTEFRAWALKQAGKSTTPAPEAALWLQLATEVDDYLDRPTETDLFGETTAEPAPEETP